VIKFSAMIRELDNGVFVFVFSKSNIRLCIKYLAFQPHI